MIRERGPEGGNRNRLHLALALGTILLAPSAEAGPKRDLREARETITEAMESLPTEWAERLNGYIQEQGLTMQADGTYQAQGKTFRLVDEGFAVNDPAYIDQSFIGAGHGEDFYDRKHDPDSLIFLPTTREGLRERQAELANLTQKADQEIEEIDDETIRQSILDVIQIGDMRIRPDGSYLSKDGQVYWLTAKGVYDADNRSTVAKRDDADTVQIRGWNGPAVGILDYLPITGSIESRQMDLSAREQAALAEVGSESREHLPKITEKERMALQESGYYIDYWNDSYYLTENGLYSENWLLSYDADIDYVAKKIDTGLCIADMIPISDEQKALVADVKQRIEGLKLERSAEGWFTRQGHAGKYMFFDNGDLLYYDGAKTQVLPQGADMNDGWRRTTVQESQAFAVKYLGLSYGGDDRLYKNFTINEERERIFEGIYLSLDSGILYISDPEQTHLTDQFLPNGADIKTGWRRPSAQELQQICIYHNDLELDQSGGYYVNDYYPNIHYYLLPNGDARVIEMQEDGTKREYIWDHWTGREKVDKKEK